MKKSTIKIRNSRAGVTTIDIEGTIGVPEEWQFDDPAGRVATYEKFSRTIAAIGRIRTAEIVVNIRSTGGDVGHALMIYDALMESGAAITTRCHGYVASAATIIAQAAGAGRREIASTALYLIHNSIGSCEGNAREVAAGVDLLTKTDERIAAIYASRSGRAPEQFAALMAENNGSGRWLSPDEALAAGLADRIVEGDRVSASSSADPMPAASGPLPANSAEADAVRTEQNLVVDGDRLRIESRAATQRSQDRAQPTEVKPIEDPSLSEGRRSANEIAYQKDAGSFVR